MIEIIYTTAVFVALAMMGIVYSGVIGFLWMGAFIYLFDGKDRSLPLGILCLILALFFTSSIVAIFLEAYWGVPHA